MNTKTLTSASCLVALATLATTLSGARAAFQTPEQRAATQAGVREAGWSPDGKRLALTWYDAIWTMAPDGRDAKRLNTAARAEPWMSERDPVWSPDGRSIAFAAESPAGFDIWIVPAGGGAARQLTTTAGDERWPSWTRDGRVMFSSRAPQTLWRLFVVTADGSGAPARVTGDDAAEWQGAVSPDGKTIAYLSDRPTEGNVDAAIWIRELPAPGTPATKPPARLTAAPGAERYPAWAPDSTRVAYYAARPNQPAAVWVSTVGTSSTPAVLASRHAGVPAWSPDGETLAIATFPSATVQYNGNPNRSDRDPPMALADASAYALWRVAAPRAVDEKAATIPLPSPDAARWTAAFDQVWQSLKSLYFATGPSAAAWDALKQTYRPQAAGARDRASFEQIVDRMIAEQPLIKPQVASARAVVASGHPLASEAGAAILARGGNVVDAGIAVSLALGVVEPDATSLGGDGQAILFIRGMPEPVVIEYKDMTPSHATTDNPKLFTATGARTASDGPTVANIPGVAAGLDLLYQKYGSKQVAWADLVAPAIALADQGFVLDDALPTTIAAGRAQFAKYPESAKLFLPGGKVPRAGDRFVNKDYAETLRTIAREGGRSFYSGTIAQKIAADMSANGGVITADDLAQYRAMERKPLSGRFRGHLVYSVPAPVSSGAQIIETLQILDQYQPKPGASYATDADYFHYAIDAWRVRDGGQRIADPERWAVDYGNHLDPAHALERFKLISPTKAYVPPAGGRRGGGPSVAPLADDVEPGRPVSTGTTAFVVADADGNMIAFTQTLSTWGGNYYVSKGLGFLYNDHFRGGAGGRGAGPGARGGSGDAGAEPDAAGATTGGGERGGGGRGTPFGSLLPLQRSNSTSVPTLVFAPQPAGAASSGIAGYAPLLAVACAGNQWIPASVYNIILNVVDARISAQRAIEAPRFLPGAGQAVQIEDRIPRAVLTDLETRGHTFTKVGRKGEVKYGYAALALVRAADRTVEAGAEPRRSHGAAAAK